MKLQETFDKILKHLRTQGHPCMIKWTETAPATCVYRNDAGESCAVGCLIPDEMYKPELEPFSAARLLSEHNKLSKYLNTLHEDHPNMNFALFLTYCQRAHDGDALKKPAEWMESMNRTMSQIAYKYYLHYTPVEGQDL